MKIVLSVFLLVIIPTISLAQLNDDGKSNSSVKIYHGYNTFTYSAAIPYGPFGLKYQYCKSFGFYSAFKTDFGLIDGDYIITIGGAKSIGQKIGFKSKPYDIPLRSLIAKDVDGLMMAGRCISGDFYAHASYRVTGNAVAMGEAAGKVAAQAVSNNKLPQDIQYK